MRIPVVASSDTAAGQIALRNSLCFQKNTNASFLNFRSFLQLQTPGGYSSFFQNGRVRALLGAPAMNHRRTEVATTSRSAAFGSTVIPGCARHVVTTHRIGGNLSCAICRHDTQSRLSNTLPPTPSVTDTPAVFSTTQTSAPIG